MDNLTGRSFKGYELRECLGEGGFGAVYRAFQPLLGRDVAVKVIRTEFANHPDFIRRFESEAQVIARLEHPHIVPLYDYWRDPTGAFLIMRWLRGGSLQAALASGPCSLADAQRLMEHLTGALSTAHRHGVVHRDVKPANVLRDEEGNYYLADFGIAKDLSTDHTDSNTASGAMLGSPAYMAPEQIKQEPVTPQTDIYLLGVLLFEVFTGQKPFAGATPTDLLYQHLYEPLPSLRMHRPDLPPALNEVIQRATQKPPGARYPDVLSLLADFTAASDAGGGHSAAQPVALPVERAATGVLENPYKGLRAFQEADAPDFFGRTALVERLLGRLSEQGTAGRFLAVVGPSGSGKSSMVRAGLLPALRAGLVAGSGRWFFTEFVPGSHPLEELEAALLRVAVNPPASLLEQLQADPRGLSRAIKRVLPADAGTELLLLIDQFEELFTLVENERLRAHVLHSLALAVADPRCRLRVILTLRADFYDRPLLYPELGELMRQGTELVLPLTAQELEQAIEQPAARVGVTIESALLATAIKDVGDQPGGLPLLQYALTELFEQREGRRLTLAGYQASGGVLGALARRADEIYGHLTPEAQDLARQVFLRLVTLGEGIEDTRRRTLQSELAGLGSADALATVLDSFGQHRLLTFDRDPITREPTVEVAHEALLRMWSRLREWLDASRMDVRTQRQLAAGAAEWEHAAHDPSFLATGTRLAQFAALAAGSHVLLTPGERRYLAASQAEAERQATSEQERQAHELELARQSAAAAQRAAQAQRRAANGLRVLVTALALFLIVATLLTLFAFGQQSEAAGQRLAAQNSAATAVANGTIADAQRATAVAYGAVADSQRATAVANGAAADSARATAQANLTHSEALRLAAEASRLMQTGGEPELAALLSVRALRDEWTSQGDAALEAAARLDLPVQQFVGQTDDVGLTLFSPDGKTLWGDSNSALFAWDVATGRQLPVPDFGGYILAIAPDGKHIAAGHDDGTITIWDMGTMTQTGVLTGHTDGLNRALYSPDGRYLLSNSQDNTARIWNVATGQSLHTLEAASNGFLSLAWSPDSKFALTGGNDDIARLWDVQTGRLVQSFDNGAGTGSLNGVSAVAYAPDGKTIATSAGAGNTEIWIWDVATGARLLQMAAHPLSIMFNIAYSGDGKTLFSSSYQDNAARLWDTTTGQQLRVFRGPDAAQTSAFAPDGRHAVVGYLHGTVLLWDTAARPELPIFTGHTGGLSSVSFSTDDRTVLTSSPGDHTARLWDATSGQELGQFHGPNDSSVNSAAFSPDGKYLLTGDGHGDKAAHTWDLRTGTMLQTFQHDANVNQAVYSPDGQTVLTASLDKTARLWNAATGQLLHTLQGDMGQVYSVAYAPDGQTVLTGGRDMIGRLWDAQAGSEIQRFVGHTQGIEHILYSPDGQRVLTASDDGTARLWDLQTGTQLGVFATHGNHAAFSPDGTRILTSGGDQVARLWDIAGAPTSPGWGRELRSLAGHTGGVGAVAFSHDGKLVLTGSDDNTARLWHVDYHDTIRDLCRRLIRDLTDDERTEYDISDATPTCPAP